MNEMRCLRLSEDAGGVSRFEDFTIGLTMQDFAPPAPSLWLSGAEPADRLVYLTLPAGWGSPQHPSPRRQVALCLAGRLRVEAGSGEVREIGPGGIWRMEDTRGAGHTTTVLGDEPVQLAIVQLVDDA